VFATRRLAAHLEDKDLPYEPFADFFDIAAGLAPNRPTHSREGRRSRSLRAGARALLTASVLPDSECDQHAVGLLSSGSEMVKIDKKL